ncbi:unnamed protein product [Echinostoma caproni]|uniref:LRRcap domain-containing protein n=1 Tax=Echinostoma caproni TaxID=27848 RepID=A0A183AB45_9TREM|nr:unnamed protein product [Echinostoma caproni]
MIDRGIRQEFDKIEENLTTEWVNQLQQGSRIPPCDRPSFDERRREAVRNMNAAISEELQRDHSECGPTVSNLNRVSKRENQASYSDVETELFDMVEDDLFSVRESVNSWVTGGESSFTAVTDALVILYVRACRRRKERVRKPIKNRLAHMCTDTNYNLRELDMNAQQFGPLSDVIRKSYRLSELDVSFNDIRTEGLQLLKPLMLESIFLKSLDISCIGMNFQGASLLKNLLTENTPLETLIVTGKLQMNKNHILRFIEYSGLITLKK